MKKKDPSWLAKPFFYNFWQTRDPRSDPRGCLLSAHRARFKLFSRRTTDR